MRDTGNNDEANTNIDNNENTSVGRARGFPSIGVMVMVIITMEMIFKSAEATGPGVLGVTSSTLHLILLPAVQVVEPCAFCVHFPPPRPASPDFASLVCLCLLDPLIFCRFLALFGPPLRPPPPPPPSCPSTAPKAGDNLPSAKPTLPTILWHETLHGNGRAPLFDR